LSLTWQWKWDSSAAVRARLLAGLPSGEGRAQLGGVSGDNRVQAGSGVLAAGGEPVAATYWLQPDAEAGKFGSQGGEGNLTFGVHRDSPWHFRGRPPVRHMGNERLTSGMTGFV
jgi:hypothetical protein